MTSPAESPSSPTSIEPFLEPRHLSLEEEVGAFVETRIRPLSSCLVDEEARARAGEIVSLLGRGGWIRWAVPEEFGGVAEAPDLRACCLVREKLAAVSPLADSLFALQALGSLPITLGADRRIRELVLPAVARGELIAAFAMTEPEAGSDVGAMSTVAKRVDGGYRLSGRKWFITNAGIADYYVVFARSGSTPGSGGISCFYVEADRPGCEFVGPQIVSEPHPLGELGFDECFVPDGHRIGEEGEGFQLGMKTLERLRVTVAAAACGMATGAFDVACEHARQRLQFGRPIGNFQLIQEKIARMAIDLSAARLMTYRAALAVDQVGVDEQRREDVGVRVAMAKAFATEAAQRIIDDAVQILGGRGVLADGLVDRLYRAVRALRIYEGTTEIQHLIVARALL